MRKTFFLNQLRQNHRVTYYDKADFTVNEKYVFEIGGKNKGKSQIASLNNNYIAQDQIAFGIDNTIPLRLFGLLY